MRTRKEIASRAIATIGVPFRHRGRLMSGLDCLGVLLQAAPWLPDSTQYGHVPDESLLVEQLSQHADQIARTEASVGDVVCFGWGSQRETHIGIITATDPVRFVHVTSKAGKVAEDLQGQMWRRMAHSYWRLRGTTDG